ncbi:MAG: flagellar basal body-associated FliL family protein [Candidatus Weimeria sp.]
MKKSLLTMITLALVLINLLLTGIIAIAIVPEVKNVNSLVSKVAAAIDLNQNGESTDDSSGSSSVPISDQTMIAIGGDDGLTINLKSDDGNSHIAVVHAQLVMNSKADSYKTNYAALTNESGAAAGQVSQAIHQTVSQYTVDQMQNDQQTVIDACTKAIQKIFDKDFVVGVSFTNVIYQ